VARLLLSRQGVEVSKTAQDGATALMVASQIGHVEVARLLLAHRDVEAHSPDGLSELMPRRIAGTAPS
jgi:hypothetical protein